MILFENAERYSNTPFWLIFNLTSLLILSLWELVGISFSFAWFLLCFFFLVSKHSDDSRVVRINIFWSWTCWSCFRFFCPDWKHILANVASFLLLPISWPFKNLWNAIHLKIFLRLWDYWAEIWKKWISWMDESFFWYKILYWPRFIDFREISLMIKILKLQIILHRNENSLLLFLRMNFLSKAYFWKTMPWV